MKNNIARAIFQAKKDGQNITANINLARDGKFASVSGVVRDLRVSRDGFSYAVIKTNGKHPYQNVRLNNILCLNKDNKLYKR